MTREDLKEGSVFSINDGDDSIVIKVLSLSRTGFRYSAFVEGNWETSPFELRFNEIDWESTQETEPPEVAAPEVIAPVAVRTSPLQELVLGVLQVGVYTSTSDIAKQVSKPVAATNSALQSLLKKDLVKLREEGHLLWSV